MVSIKEGGHHDTFLHQFKGLGQVSDVGQHVGRYDKVELPTGAASGATATAQVVADGHDAQLLVQLLLTSDPNHLLGQIYPYNTFNMRKVKFMLSFIY